MSEIVEITYVPRETAIESWSEQIVLGCYRVRYDDEFQVLMPHVGWSGTLSAEPLDPSDDEHWNLLVQAAERIRMAHDVETEIELWRMADGGEQ